MVKARIIAKGGLREGYLADAAGKYYQPVSPSFQPRKDQRTRTYNGKLYLVVNRDVAHLPKFVKKKQQSAVKASAEAAKASKEAAVKVNSAQRAARAAKNAVGGGAITLADKKKARKALKAAKAAAAAADKAEKAAEKVVEKVASAQKSAEKVKPKAPKPLPKAPKAATPMDSYIAAANMAKQRRLLREAAAEKVQKPKAAQKPKRTKCLGTYRRREYTVPAMDIPCPKRK